MKKNKPGSKATYVLMGFVLVLIAVVFFIAMFNIGEVKYYDNRQDSISSESVTCKAADIDYPLFETSGALKKEAVINLFFENDEINKIGLAYTVTYNSAEDASKARDVASLKLSQAMISDGLDSVDALDNRFSIYDDQMIMNLYAEKSDISAKTASYLMINTDSDGVLQVKKKGGYVKNYQKMGFTCTDN